MPIYEYACARCRKIFSFLVRNTASHKAPKCPRCGKEELARAISPFRIGRNDESRAEKLADPAALSGIDENDPRSIARWMKKMGGELGEDMPGDLDEMVDRLEAGESPEDVEGGGGGYSRDSSGELHEG
jgi:putative FmdB family regulatory protein